MMCICGVEWLYDKSVYVCSIIGQYLGDAFQERIDMNSKMS